MCERLAGRRGRLAALTGLPLDPYFAAPKMTWLRENLTADGVVTTTDTWLLARLGGGVRDGRRHRVPDAAARPRPPAGRGGVRAFGLDPAALPEVADCAAVVGETTAFGKAVPVAGLAVDQQAALLAERCFAAGEAKCTYGTGAFLLATTGANAVRSAGGLSASIAWRLAGAPTYCLDGQVYTAGAAIRWLGEVGLLRDAGRDRRGRRVGPGQRRGDVPAVAGRARRAALAPGGPRGVPRARPGHHAGAPHPGGRRGLAASVALLAGAVASDLGRQLTVLRADGGLTRSRLLMQAQADLLQLPVEVCRTPDATALGVAALARIGLGQAAGPEQAVGPAEVEAVIEPRIGADEAAERMAGFARALQATLAAASDRTGRGAPGRRRRRDHRGRGGRDRDRPRAGRRDLSTSWWTRRPTSAPAPPRRTRPSCTPGSTRCRAAWRAACCAGAARCCATTQPGPASRSSAPAPCWSPGPTSSVARCRKSRKKRGRTDTPRSARSPRRGSTSGNPIWARGTGRAGDPGREHHLPLDHAAGLRHRGGAGRCRLELGRVVTGVRQRAGGHALATTRGTVAAAGSSTPPGWAGTWSTRCSGGRLRGPPAPRRAHRLRQAGAAAARLDPAAGANRGDQGGAGGPDRVRQRAARAHRRGHR